MRNILVDNLSNMDRVAEALLERENIEGKELDELLRLNGEQGSGPEEDSPETSESTLEKEPTAPQPL